MLNDGDHRPARVRGAALRWGPNLFDFYYCLGYTWCKEIYIHFVITQNLNEFFLAFLY